MRSAVLLLLAGCSVPYEVDPNFDAEPLTTDSGVAFDTTAPFADTGGSFVIDTGAPDTGRADPDTRVVDTGTIEDTGCPSGYADCEGYGCDTPITDNVKHCGGCGVACSVPNGVPKCTGTTCGIARCAGGFGDCNGNYSDGCEQILNTTAHCGGCGVACARANASTSCSIGACAIAACNTGFDNCDGDSSNGCETNVRTAVDHCGGCGRRCTVTNGTGVCSAGACTLAACAPGYSNCDAEPLSCEVSHAAAANTCATADRLAEADGTDLCGTSSASTATPVSTRQSRFYRVRLVRCGGCNGSNRMRARITLQNPAGAAYDLHVWSSTTCGGAPTRSSTSGALGGTETVTLADLACDSSRELSIEVRYRAGASCAPATLNVTGAY